MEPGVADHGHVHGPQAEAHLQVVRAADHREVVCHVNNVSAANKGREQTGSEAVEPPGETHTCHSCSVDVSQADTRNAQLSWLVLVRRQVRKG